MNQTGSADRRRYADAATVARASAELAALGVPPETALELAARIRRYAEGVARALVELFLDEAWKPFEQTGRPTERWPEVREALERLRPPAAESLLAIFQITMSEAVEEAFGRELGDDRAEEH